MYGDAIPVRQRLGPAALSAALAGAIGWALLTGLGIAMPAADQPSLALFDIVPPRPPEPPRVVAQRQRSHRPEGRAAPAGLRAQATQIVAPPPPVIVPPPLLVTTPVIGTGNAPRQGAADTPGPGPGAGGIGDGRGSGNGGDGDGGPGYETEPHWLKGRIRFRDVEDAGGEEKGDAIIGRSLSVSCTLLVNTRLTNCVARRSSGLPALDRRVIDLIEQRFRYAPWLDENGQPVESTILIDQSWSEDTGR